LAHDVVVFQSEKALAEFNQKTNSNFVLSKKESWNERRLNFMAQVNARLDFEQLQQLSTQQLSTPATPATPAVASFYNNQLGFSRC